MSKIKLLYISIIGLFLITQACKRDNADSGCPSYTTNYQTLSIGAINQTPYFTNPAFDTISFASDKGDTVTFVKTKTDTSWYCENDNSNADCPKENANCYQVLHNSYTTIKGVGNFELKHTLKGYLIFDFINISFNQINFSMNDWVIGDNTNPAYVKYLNVGTKNYTNLTKIIRSNSTQDVAYTFINKKYGLIYVEDIIENIKWQLVK